MSVALIGGKLEEARRFHSVLRQSPVADHVEQTEIDLPARVPLVGGELEEARRLALVLRQAATAVLV